MERQPLIIVILKVPFEVALRLSGIGKFFLNYLSNLVLCLLWRAFRCLDFRSRIPLMMLSGLLKMGLLGFIVLSTAFGTHALLGSISLGNPILSALTWLLATKLVFLGFKHSRSFPEVKSELQSLIEKGFGDFVCLVLSLVVALSLIGVPQLFGAPKDPEKYLEFILGVSKEVALDLLDLPFFLLLSAFPWRLLQRMYSQPESYKVLSTLKMLREGLKDLPFILLYVVCLCLVVKALTLIKLTVTGKVSREAILNSFKESVVVLICLALVGVILIMVFRVCSTLKKIKLLIEGEISEKECFEMLLEDLVDSFLSCLVFPFLVVLFVTYYRLPSSYLEKDLLFNSRKLRELLGCTFEETIELLIDLYHTVILLVCLPFIWRSLPGVARVLKSTWKRNEIQYLCSTVLKDLVAVLLGVLIVVTLYRIPLLFRRKKKQVHIVYAVKDVFSELLLDSLVIPFLLVKLVCPWRLVPAVLRISKTSSPKLQRKIIKKDGLRPFEDYLTVLLSLVLLLSVWRATETLSIITTHLRQVLKQQEVTSSLFRKIFRQFCQLLIDLLMTFMILFVFGMIVEVPAFLKRIRSFYYIYKERRGIQSLRYFKSFFSPKKQQIETRNRLTITRLNKNVFSVIASYVDIKTLGNMLCVNTKMKNLTEFQPIWKYHYESTWKEHLTESRVKELAWEDNYQKLAIEGFQHFNEKNKEVILNEEERDYKMGARAIVLEEFVLSIFGLPHMIALPAKGVCYLLSKIDFETYTSTPRYPNLSYIAQFKPNYTFDQLFTHIKNDCKPSEDTLKSFYHIQLNFLYILLTILGIVMEHFVYTSSKLTFAVMEQVSFGTNIPFTGGIPRRMNLSIWHYSAQLLASLVLACAHLLILVLPFLLSYLFSSYSCLGCVFGPCYLNLVVYFSLFSEVSTIYGYITHFPNFKPFLPLRVLVLVTCSKFGSLATRGVRLLDSFVIKVLYYPKWLVLRFWGFLELLKNGTFSAYKMLLVQSVKWAKKLGLLGEILFIPICLAWIFWPLCLMMHSWSSLVVALPLTVLFLVKGYKLVDSEWKSLR